MKTIMFIPCIMLICLCSIRNAQAEQSNPQNVGDATAIPPSPQTSAPEGANADLELDNYSPFRGEHHDNFDFSLVQLALLKPESNMIISPLSVKYLLTLLWEAAAPNSNTKKELSTVLSLGQDNQRTVFGQIISSLKQKSNSYDLKFDTRIFVNQFIEPTQRFSAIAETYYRTLIERLDFGDASRSADYINEWCSQATNGNIRKVVDANDLHNSVMLMLNAIYFKGLWRRPFPRNQTTELPFHISSTQQVKTKYIVETGSYYYLDSPKLNAKFIRIPYKGKKFSMIIALPNANEGLGELTRQLDSAAMQEVKWLIDLAAVRVAIPKFKFETTTSMNELIKQMGIQEIFTTEASLPMFAHGAGIQNQLRVSNITQKAGIQVDEEGSTTYVVTEVALINKFGDSEFIADRPFLFFIQDETTQTLLFAGKVTNPGEFTIPK